MGKSSMATCITGVGIENYVYVDPYSTKNTFP